MTPPPPPTTPPPPPPAPPPPSPLTDVPHVPTLPAAAPPTAAPTSPAPTTALHAAAFPTPAATGADRLASRRRRRRRVRLAVFSLLGLCIAAASVPFVRGIQDGLAKQQIPDATAPGFRSAQFTEIIVAPTVTGGTRTESVANADIVDRQVQVEVIEGEGSSWRGDDDEWFQQDTSGEWIRLSNSAEDDMIFRDLMMIADGLTVDEVLPLSARRFTDITSVERSEMLGDDVRHFTALVDVHAMGRRDPDALTDLERFWSALDLEDFEANTGLAIEFWTTDDGMVHQVRSKADAGLGSYTLTFDHASADEAFDAALPSDFIDG